VITDWRIDWAIPGLTPFGQPPPSAALPRPSQEVTAYTAAVQALAAVEVRQLPPEQALADLTELLQTDQTLRVARLSRLRDGHARKLATLADEVSLQTWARNRFDDVPREDLATAEQLRRYPVLARRVTVRAVTVEAGRCPVRSAALPRVVSTASTRTAFPPFRSAAASAAARSFDVVGSSPTPPDDAPQAATTSEHVRASRRTYV
jgi:hypothetical protein